MNYSSLKIVILGRYEIGKSIFILRLLANNNKEFFNSNYLIYNPNVSSNFSQKFIKFNNEEFKLAIWDLPGAENYFSLQRIFLKDSHATLLFYDSFKRTSFEKIKREYSYNKDILNNMVFLIRTKYDSKIKSKINDFVSDEEAIEYADKNNMIFLHISSFEKNDNGFENLLNLITKQYLLQNKNNI